MPLRSSLSKSNISFIKANRLKMSATAMAEKFGRSKTVVQKFLKNNGLSVPKSLVRKWASEKLIGRSIVDEYGDFFICCCYLDVPVKTMASMLGYEDGIIKRRIRQLGLVIPPEIIERNRKVGQIKPGSVPPNKGKKIRDYMSPEAIKKVMATTFKKGEPNHNELHDGAITIRHSMPYKGGHPHKYIRIAKGKWKELQILNWEKENGPVPKGHVLACKNGDTLDCSSSNWYIITKKENMLRNSSSLRLTDGFIAQTLARVKGVKGKIDHQLMKSLRNQPELLDLKRQSLILNRTINERRKAS